MHTLNELEYVAMSFLWRIIKLASHPTPANAVVVEVLASLWAKHLDHHAVQVEAFHQHPGEGAQEEEVKQDSHDLAGQLVEEGESNFYHQSSVFVS